VYPLLAHPRVVVEVSGYGSEPGRSRTDHRARFFENLRRHRVIHRYDEAAQWIDFGDFRERGFDDEAWRRVYQTCCFVSNDLFNGELHKCSRSAYGSFLGKIPVYRDDFVDVRGTPPGQLRAAIAAYLKHVPRACQHCDGTTTRTMPAGVQLVRAPRGRRVDGSGA
jgi:hypothetical protein